MIVFYELFDYTVGVMREVVYSMVEKELVMKEVGRVVEGKMEK